MKQRVYIAGPMTGRKYWNFPAFTEAEEKLRELGYDVINPAKNFDGRTDLPWHVYLMKAIDQVASEADLIYFLDGWEQSSGAQIECIVAKKTQTPELVLYTEDGNVRPIVIK